MLALQSKELEEGESALKKAIGIKLQRTADQALAKLNLAHIYYVKKEYNSASQLLEEVKAAQVEDLLIKDNIKKLELALANMQ